MSLGASIASNAEMMRTRAHELDAWLNELKTLLPDSERARQVFINARQTIGSVHSEITQIQTTLAAARMCGAMNTAHLPPSQPELALPVEMRAASRPRQRAPDRKMLAAGDYTLADDDETTTSLHMERGQGGLL